MGLKTKEGEFNILVQLLSDNSHFPLRVSIFDEETKGSNLFSVREFGNDCLLYSLDELLRYGDVLNLIRTDETDRVVERKEVPLFDNKAFREAIINAVLHSLWKAFHNLCYAKLFIMQSHLGIAPKQGLFSCLS